MSRSIFVKFKQWQFYGGPGDSEPPMILVWVVIFIEILNSLFLTYSYDT